MTNAQPLAALHPQRRGYDRTPFPIAPAPAKGGMGSGDSIGRKMAGEFERLKALPNVEGWRWRSRRLGSEWQVDLQAGSYGNPCPIWVGRGPSEAAALDLAACWALAHFDPVKAR